VSARAWALFAAVSVVWGVPYLFIKLAVDDGVSPTFLAWSRVTIGALLLLPLAIRAGALRGLRERAGVLVAYSIAEIVLPFPLIAYGEQHVASSLAAILIATAPLIVAVLAIRFDPTERATGLRLAGLLVGLAGVVALLGIDVAGNAKELLGAAAILCAAVGYAIGPMLVKRRFGDVDPIGPVTGSLVISAVLLAPAAGAALPAHVPSAKAIAALVVLGVVCSATAFLLYFGLIAEVGAGRALVITYINPVIAVALGVVFLGEHPGAGAVAGLLLILAGSWLSTDGRLPPGLGRRATRAQAASARRRWSSASARSLNRSSSAARISSSEPVMTVPSSNRSVGISSVPVLRRSSSRSARSAGT
jgi:drug/metabolite transporter (DMT)-like permease